jgi:hypothetical protein
MLNISKCQKLIVGCSAIAAAAVVGAVQSPSAIAQTTTGSTNNSSNASGTNVTTTTNPSVSGGTPGPSPAISGRAGTVSANIGVLSTRSIAATANRAQIESTPNTVADTSPIRLGRQGVADLASCGCPNADTVGTNTTTERPELVAAKAAEAQAAAELAAAKAEARQFIESVKSGSASSSTADSRLW